MTSKTISNPHEKDPFPHRNRLRKQPANPLVLRSFCAALRRNLCKSLNCKQILVVKLKMFFRPILKTMFCAESAQKCAEFFANSLFLKHLHFSVCAESAQKCAENRTPRPLPLALGIYKPFRGLLLPTLNRHIVSQWRFKEND